MGASCIESCQEIDFIVGRSTDHSQQGEELEIDGIRKEVVRLIFRLGPALDQSRAENE